MTLAWFILVCATLALYGLAERADPSRLLVGVVIVIAAFKVRLVFLYFMELNSGATPWRRIAEAWVGAVATLLLVAYFVTG